MLHRNDAGEPCGLITNIQKYTIHDGPGIRTELFFKGCNMHCPWCSNPETVRAENELGCYSTKCLSLDKCSWCVRACPLGGAPLVFDDTGVLKEIRQATQCLTCMKCAGICPSRAVKAWGSLMTVPELMAIIEEDRSFYEKTGGGVTLNGGEVLLQWEFAELLLKACKGAGINTCVESALNVPREHLDAVLPYTDLLITDIKLMDSEKHRAVTGSGNERILDNIRHAAQAGVRLVIRTPVVFGYNAEQEDLRAIGRFLTEGFPGKLVQYQLLPYRRMGTEKYDSLGRPYPMETYNAPERSEWEPRLLALTEMLRKEFGLPATAGSNGKLEIS